MPSPGPGSRDILPLLRQAGLAIQAALQHTRGNSRSPHSPGISPCSAHTANSAHWHRTGQLPPLRPQSSRKPEGSTGLLLKQLFMRPRRPTNPGPSLSLWEASQIHSSGSIPVPCSNWSASPPGFRQIRSTPCSQQTAPIHPGRQQILPRQAVPVKLLQGSTFTLPP